MTQIDRWNFLISFQQKRSMTDTSHSLQYYRFCVQPRSLKGQIIIIQQEIAIV